MTTTSIFTTVPQPIRPKRHQSGNAERMLQLLRDHSSDGTLQQLAYGVIWADHTCRTTGTISMAIRRATAWQVARMIGAMVADGVSTAAAVPAWLNSRGLDSLAAA
jgi:hypothetical protein